MHFYLGNRKEDININDFCVELSDELDELISVNMRKYDFDISALVAIDPYDHVEIGINDVRELNIVFDCLIKTGIFDSNEDHLEELLSLKNLTKLAIDQCCGIVSIGD